MKKLEAIKQEYLESLPHEAKEAMQPIHFSMIDELIEKCLSGESTFNGNPPSDQQEYNILISMGLVETLPVFHGMVKGAALAFPDEEVNINVNYRGKTFRYSKKPNQNFTKWDG
jgi:hypothetical protein